MVHWVHPEYSKATWYLGQLSAKRSCKLRLMWFCMCLENTIMRLIYWFNQVMTFLHSTGVAYMSSNYQVPIVDHACESISRHVLTDLAQHFGEMSIFCISENSKFILLNYLHPEYMRIMKPTHISSHGCTQPQGPYQKSMGEVPFIW